MAWSNQSELFKMIILEFVCSQIFMLQRRKMRPDDFVDTSPLDIFTHVSSRVFVTHARLIAVIGFLASENL